jgi:hypothetical protein
MFLLNHPYKVLRKGLTRFEIPDMHVYSAVHFLSRLSRALRFAEEHKPGHFALTENYTSKDST